MATQRHFYGVHNPYGIWTANIDGQRANYLRRFDTAANRDVWVALEDDSRYPCSAVFARRIVTRNQRAMSIDPWRLDGFTVSFMDED